MEEPSAALLSRSKRLVRLGRPEPLARMLRSHGASGVEALARALVEFGGEALPDQSLPSASVRRTVSALRDCPAVELAAAALLAAGRDLLGGARVRTCLLFLETAIELIEGKPSLAGAALDSLAAHALAMADLRLSLGEVWYAERHLQRGIEIEEGLLLAFPDRSEPGEQLARGLTTRGLLLHDLGRSSQAEEDLRRAASLMRQRLRVVPCDGGAQVRLGQCHLALGEVLVGTDRTDLAMREFLEAEVLLAEAYEEGSAYEVGLLLSQARVLVGKALTGLERWAEAEAVLREGEVQLRLSIEPEGPPEIGAELARAQLALATILCRTGRPNEALWHATQSMYGFEEFADSESELVPGQRMLAAALVERSSVHQVLGQQDESSECLDEAIGVLADLHKRHLDLPGVAADLAAAQLERSGLRMRDKQEEGGQEDLCSAEALLRDHVPEASQRSDWAETRTLVLKARGQPRKSDRRDCDPT